MKRLHKHFRLLCLASLLMAGTAMHTTDVTIDGITYTLGTDSSAIVTSFQSRTLSGKIIIPDTITFGGTKYFVDSLADKAFYQCMRITSVTIPSSVTSLGLECFLNCSSLTSVTIPSFITSLGQSCFDDCSSLTSVTIPSSVTSVGAYGFQNCTG